MYWQSNATAAKHTFECMQVALDLNHIVACSMDTAVRGNVYHDSAPLLHHTLTPTRCYCSQFSVFASYAADVTRCRPAGKCQLHHAAALPCMLRSTVSAYTRGLMVYICNGSGELVIGMADCYIRSINTS